MSVESQSLHDGRLSFLPTANFMRVLVFCFLIAVSATSLAETAYVTDLLRLGLHRAEDTSDSAFRTLESGQEMEILSRTRNYAEVRLPDGTQGYVKAAYLVTDKPAKLIVAEAQAEIDALNSELEALRAAFAEPGETIERLEGEVGVMRTQLDSATAEAAEKSAELERLDKNNERYRYSLPYRWVLIAVGVCLIGGFLFGLWWFDYRSRRRHGGIRVY
jgi:SH3 domain protein